MKLCCVKYKINEDGTLPDFVVKNPNGHIFFFATAQIENNVPVQYAVGLGNFEKCDPKNVFETQVDLEAYLTTVCSIWKEEDGSDFCVKKAAEKFWAELQKMSA